MYVITIYLILKIKCPYAYNGIHLYFLSASDLTTSYQYSTWRRMKLRNIYGNVGIAMEEIQAVFTSGVAEMIIKTSKNSILLHLISSSVIILVLQACM